MSVSSPASRIQETLRHGRRPSRAGLHRLQLFGDAFARVQAIFGLLPDRLQQHEPAQDGRFSRIQVVSRDIPRQAAPAYARAIQDTNRGIVAQLEEQLAAGVGHRGSGRRRRGCYGRAPIILVDTRPAIPGSEVPVTPGARSPIDVRASSATSRTDLARIHENGELPPARRHARANNTVSSGVVLPPGRFRSGSSLGRTLRTGRVVRAPLVVRNCASGRR